MKKRDYSKGCGASIGHNEVCVRGYLCNACLAEVIKEKRGNALIVQISIMKDALETISRQCDAYAKAGIGYDRDIDLIAKEALKKVQ
jgi:hypothetical protein